MSTLGSIKNKVTATDLLAERAKCAFDAVEMREILSGGKHIVDLKEKYAKILNKPELKNYIKFNELDVNQQQTDLWRRIQYIHENHPELFEESQVNKYPYVFWVNGFQGLLPGVGLHYTMFQSSVSVLANEEQAAHWIPLIKKHKILGCYAQTELGHGSNVASLETTATLDKATDEWVINSPTTTSAKYWPGDLGRFTTHAVLFARCKVGDQDYGVNAFMVQLRDVDTFKHMKGVKTGDLGPKFGYVSKDNGWATFDHVRIPRTNMLMGIVSISKDGDFEIKGDPKVLYTTMMLIRTSIVLDCPIAAESALLIALRYGTCRRQFATIKGTKVERQIIDYQTFQSQLTPLLTQCLMQNIVGTYIREQFRELQDQVSKGIFDKLPVMHHLLAGLKAQISDSMMHTFDKARRQCGGAGYQSNSGFTEIFMAISPIQTYEGDNTVMLLQSARYLFKLVKWAQKGKELPYPFEYISKAQALTSIKGKGKSVDECKDIQVLEQALAVRALTQITFTVKMIEASDAHAKVKDNELFSRMKLDMIKAHMEFITHYLFRTQLEKMQLRDARLKPIFDDIYRITALRSLVDDCGTCYESGYFAPSAMSNMNMALDQLIAKLRPQLIPLCEASVQHEVQSNIGNEYGDIYEQQLELAMDSKMQHIDKNGVPPQWEQYIKPFLHKGGRAKL